MRKVAEAAREGDVERLQELIDDGYEYKRCPTDKELSPLHEAIAANQNEAMNVIR